VREGGRVVASGTSMRAIRVSLAACSLVVVCLGAEPRDARA
jgi:hypothetical protein